MVLTPGGVTGVAISLACALDMGDEVLVPDPSWPNYEMAARVLGAVPVPYLAGPETNWVPQIAEVERRITRKTRAVILCTPSNPSGRVMPRETVDGILQLAQKHGLAVISDEMYSDIVFDGAQHHSVLASPHFPEMERATFMVSGVSKAYSMTGFRCGYVRASSAAIPALGRLLESTVSCGVPFAQRGAAAALAGPQDSVVEARDAYERRRNAAVEELLAHGLRVPGMLPDGAFYLLLRCARPGAAGDNSARVARELLEREAVAVAPGAAFGTAARNHLRASFCASEADVREGMRRIARHLLDMGLEEV